MQPHTRLEISVGAFIACACLALIYLSVTLAGVQFGGSSHYPISARFSSVGSLKVGDPVKVAGVNVGDVSSIRLVDFVAEANFSIDSNIKLPSDTIASIQSAGLLGDSFVSLSPGASEKDLAPGARVSRTEPAISLTELIAKYAFGSPLSEKDTADKDTAENESGDKQAEAKTKSRDENAPSDELDLDLPLGKHTAEGATASSTARDVTTAPAGASNAGDAPAASGSRQNETAKPPGAAASGKASKSSPFMNPLE
ncbi:MAG TPA: outer membrane lipid asymmetry maintenance protein MlaD [Polyangiaceae bacterium]|jgi:phospholipid/cholesterol/gamma-HCH transport system substrate-binding protein|nr:outer membrane lipid asymmetry maintenance protein MlaD [Polyangiaceae bacterium]